MYCSRCGAEIKSDGQFCARCGQQVHVATKKTVEEIREYSDQNSNPIATHKIHYKIWFALAMVVAVLVMVISLINSNAIKRPLGDYVSDQNSDLIMRFDGDGNMEASDHGVAVPCSSSFDRMKDVSQDKSSYSFWVEVLNHGTYLQYDSKLDVIYVEEDNDVYRKVEY